jgi:hypothetical protein
MYIEGKAGNLIGPERIGRVTYSKTGATIFYRGKEFRSLKGRGSRPATTTWKPAMNTGFLAREKMVATRSTLQMSQPKLTVMP